MAIPYHEIEEKWQKIWDEKKIFKFNPDDTDKKLYTLVMFSYPSSAKLHVGHWFNYGPTDSWARFKRMQGYNVFEPMGFDSFGLPAENYAVKTNIHPHDTTETNITDIRGQIKRIGAMYDWDMEVITSHPDYYKWTQWLFLRLFEKGLAYRSKAPVNWCPSCNTVLANEQVVDGKCERCDTEVIRKDLTQWFFKITDYADRLLEGLDKIDWPEKTKAMQRNWIGRSEGARIRFSIAGSEESFDVFTTRPDTLWGVTYMVLAPEHPLVEKITVPEKKEAVEKYILETRKLTETERLSTVKEKTGVFTGAYAVNPVNGEEIPVWIGDYVLGSYGYGAVMAVPAHDQRDFEFAAKYELPVRKVILAPGEKGDEPISEAYTEPGIMYQSGKFDGTNSKKGIDAVITYLEENGYGERIVNYRLRDWLVSRQRYWGAPIPIVHCEKCGEVAVKDEDLPVELPYDVDFKPTGESPLASHEGFLNTVCPKCGGPAVREADTMDTFVDSSWYFLRYLDPGNRNAAFDTSRVNKWMPVDKYVGGAEHAVMHLLYARFFTMALHDMGMIDFDEPFHSLVHQGVILGPDGNRMSKSRGNVINPEQFLEKFGSDVFRGYLMFGFAYTEGGPWNDNGIAAIDRFYNRIWRSVERFGYTVGSNKSPGELNREEKELYRIMHHSIKGVTEDTERFQFNTSISRIMELVNGIYKYGEDKSETDINAPLMKEVIVNLVKLIAPFAPHLGQELWAKLGLSPEFVVDASWPRYDPEVLVAEQVTVVVQINGKIRDRIEVDKDLDREKLEETALAHGRIPGLLEGKTIRKVIVVPNKLVNIVAN
jgi:leucyl-tRNA synthetase